MFHSAIHTDIHHWDALQDVFIRPYGEQSIYHSVTQTNSITVLFKNNTSVSTLSITLELVFKLS